MRESLIAFIRSVQATAAQLRAHVQIGEDGRGYLWFGYGYFGRGKVLWWPPNAGDVFEELSVEDGVERFLASYGVTS